MDSSSEAKLNARINALEQSCNERNTEMSRICAAWMYCNTMHQCTATMTWGQVVDVLPYAFILQRSVDLFDANTELQGVVKLLPNATNIISISNWLRLSRGITPEASCLTIAGVLLACVHIVRAGTGP